MDRRVKERLIGATILVALIVLIVPELLPGPKPAPVQPLTDGLPGTTRNVSVNLTTSKAVSEPQSADAAPLGAETHETQGGGASTGKVGGPPLQGASQEASAPATVSTLKAQESAAPVETAISSPKSAGESPVASDATAAHAHRAWVVQLGSFASKSNAEKLLHQLPSGGFYLDSSGSGASLRYRVRMGPLADRGAAERAVTKLKGEGHAATIVKPAS